MMKKILILSAIAVILAACQSKTEYTISGEVTDTTFEGKQVNLVQITEDEMVPVDSATVTNGKFQFKGDTETPLLRIVSLGNDQNKPQTVVMVEPGKIKVAYDSTFHVSGTPLNDELNEFRASQKELTTKIRSISDQYNAAMADGSLTDELDEELTAAYEKVADERKASYYDFIKSNIDNELGQYFFITSSGMFEADKQKEILDMTNDEFKNKKNVKRIVDQLEAMEAVAIGKDYKDFTMKDPKGVEVSLSDYVGKGNYVLVDFWASWCGPCRDEMPNVVEAYKTYKNKGLEIVGVSLDKEEDKWKQGIKDLNMTWPQMSDLKLWESEVVKLYAIRGIPHTVLLDKEGKIIAKDLRGEELDKKLAELLD